MQRGKEQQGMEVIPVEVGKRDDHLDVLDEEQPVVKQLDEDQSEEQQPIEPQGESSPVLRRSSRVIKPPIRYSLTCNFSYALLTDVGEPSSYQEACGPKCASKWRVSMEEEMEALHKNKTWELVPLPKGRKAIGNKWVFELKRDLNDNLETYKARLVAKGYAWKFGIDFDQIFSSVVVLLELFYLLMLVLIWS